MYKALPNISERVKMKENRHNNENRTKREENKIKMIVFYIKKNLERDKKLHTRQVSINRFNIFLSASP